MRGSLGRVGVGSSSISGQGGSMGGDMDVDDRTRDLEGWVSGHVLQWTEDSTHAMSDVNEAAPLLGLRQWWSR